MDNKILTRDELIDYLLEHKRKWPDKGHYHVELRDRIIVAEPKVLAHDDKMQVVILAGIQYR